MSKTFSFSHMHMHSYTCWNPCSHFIYYFRQLMLEFFLRSFYTGIGIHLLTSDGTLGPEKEVYGFPDGSKINFVSWYSPEIQTYSEISGPYWILLWNCFNKDMLPFLNMHLFLTESFNKAKQNWTYQTGRCFSSNMITCTQKPL